MIIVGGEGRRDFFRRGRHSLCPFLPIFLGGSDKSHHGDGHGDDDARVGGVLPQSESEKEREGVRSLSNPPAAALATPHAARHHEYFFLLKLLRPTHNRPILSCLIFRVHRCGSPPLRSGAACAVINWAAYVGDGCACVCVRVCVDAPWRSSATAGCSGPRCPYCIRVECIWGGWRG